MEDRLLVPFAADFVMTDEGLGLVFGRETLLLAPDADQRQPGSARLESGSPGCSGRGCGDT